jgi:hypothetical protein
MRICWRLALACEAAAQGTSEAYEAGAEEKKAAGLRCGGRSCGCNYLFAREIGGWIIVFAKFRGQADTYIIGG